MRSDTFFHVDISGCLAVIAYVRPPINMLSFAALGQLEQLLLELSGREDVSVVVLTGGVEGFFAAHADTEDVMRMENGQPPVGDPDAWDRANLLLTDMPQLTVAAVNGQAWGGGCETALACNLILLSEAGHFRLLEVSKGVLPGAGGTQRLTRRVGVPRALHMILSTRILSGQEAVEWGLADALLPAENFISRVTAWLEPILCQPVHAVRAAKSVIVQGSRLSLDEGLQLEKQAFARLVSCDATKALGEKTVETL